MLKHQLKNYQLILGSGSPRRQKYMEDLDIPFIKILKPIDETYPGHLKGEEIPEYISILKAEPFKPNLKENDILITCDTIVWHNKKALGKPNNEKEAIKMLKSMSGKSHEVITSVCLTTTKFQTIKSATTKVYFKVLSNSEIEFYVQSFKPFDKAGAYGIQEWIGQIGIDRIEGSYENVVGLPTAMFYGMLKEILA